MYFLHYNRFSFTNASANRACRLLKVALLCALFLTPGCTVTNLQQVEVDAPTIQPPVRVTGQPQEGALLARGNLSWSQGDPLETLIEGHTNVNSDGVFEVEPFKEDGQYLERAGVNVQRFRGNNFSWNAPQWQGNVEFEWLPVSSFSLLGGLGISAIDGKPQFSQNVGMGVNFGSETVAVRLDLGMSFYQSRYTIQAVQGQAKRFGDDRVRIIRLVEFEDQDRYRDMTFGFTLNSRHPGKRINYFFNYTTGRQHFYDVRDEVPFAVFGQQERFDYKYSEPFNSFSIGVFTNLPENSRILLGGRWTKYNDELDQLSLFNMFVQYEVKLF